jgi:hypothetical protein
MHWDVYTAFSVITGVGLLIAGLAVPGVSTKSRIYAVVGGAFYVVYGIYVARQTSGTYYFPVFIFVLPIAAIIGLVIKFSSANQTQRARSATKTGTGRVEPQTAVRPHAVGEQPPRAAAPRVVPERTAVVVPGQGGLAAHATRGRCGHDVRPEARFCTVCGRPATEIGRPAVDGRRSATDDGPAAVLPQPLRPAVPSAMTDWSARGQPRNTVPGPLPLRPRHALPATESALRLDPRAAEPAARGEPSAVRPGRHARR